jgi:L-fuculose-phosphate aldolase
VTLRDSPALREELIRAARRLTASGLTRNTSGNLSHRVEDGLIVTPSGMAYDALTAEDIVHLSWSGDPSGRRLPSSEWRFHRDILKARAEISVVLHAHPPYATALACHRLGIPPFHYMVAKLGGADVRCSGYATFGTAELSAEAVKALDGRKACLLANHGIIALGGGFEQALALAIEVEALAEMYVHARVLGEPVLLDPDEMAVNVGKFGTYGYQPPLPGDGP